MYLSWKINETKTHQVEGCPVKIRVLLAHQSRVDVLEDFVESELAHTLHRVTDRGGGPSQEEVLRATLLVGDLESITKTLVFLLVYLKILCIDTVSKLSKNIFFLQKSEIIQRGIRY